MRADRLHVAVRPRGILECLDLAIMFCGRRPLAVIVAITLGAAPFIAINRLLYDQSMNWYVAYLLLGLEAAWASVPLTLYLGQAVFADRFSWQTATRSLVGSLPALFAFQGLLRGICLVLVFLAPVVFVAMYYLNQVIVLERPRFSRIWSRRGAINQRNTGHVLGLAMINAIILVVGVPMMTGLLAAISSVWMGRPTKWLSFSPGTSIIQSLFSWHGQIAFWSVCGLLTVFRFFTYLDARIRREGWDVELKLRSATTYAGLPESKPGRSMAGAAAWLMVIVMTGLMPTAIASDEGPGEGAKRALARQSFPWYDAPRDSFRSLIQPDREASGGTTGRTARGSRGWSGPGTGSGTGSGAGSGESPWGVRIPWSFDFPVWNIAWLGQVLMIGLFIVAALVIVYLVVRYGLPLVKRRKRPVHDGEIVDELDEDRLAALPDGARLTGSDLLARAAACAEEGNFQRAMVFYFAWQLLELDRRGGLTLSRGKTNGQYVAEVAAMAPAVAGLFRRSSRLFEDAFFGDLAVAEADFQGVWDERNRIESFVQLSAHDSVPPQPGSLRGTAVHAAHAVLLALAATLATSTGCERNVATEYAAVRGGSINGVTAFVQLLRDTGHTVIARQYLPEKIDPAYATIVVFDDSFTGLSPAAEEILTPFLDSSGTRTILLVLRDSDCFIDYLRGILADDDLDADIRTKAETILELAEKTLEQMTSEVRPATPPFPDDLTTFDRPPTGEAIDVLIQWRPNSEIEREIKARWDLRRRFAPVADEKRVKTLWSSGVDRLLVRRKDGSKSILVLASAAPILNGGLVDPGNRLLAEDLASLLPTEGKVLVAGSAWVAGECDGGRCGGGSRGGGGGGGDNDENDEEDPPSPWRLLAVQPLPWVAAQAIIAMALFCWCTSPIFGRPKRSSPTHSQDFGHHVAALGSLLAKSPEAARDFARLRLEAWRDAAAPGRSKHRRRPRS